MVDKGRQRYHAIIEVKGTKYNKLDIDKINDNMGRNVEEVRCIELVSDHHFSWSNGYVGVNIGIHLV